MSVLRDRAGPGSRGVPWLPPRERRLQAPPEPLQVPSAFRGVWRRRWAWGSGACVGPWPEPPAGAPRTAPRARSLKMNPFELFYKTSSALLVLEHRPRRRHHLPGDAQRVQGRGGRGSWPGEPGRRGPGLHPPCLLVGSSSPKAYLILSAPRWTARDPGLPPSLSRVWVSGPLAPKASTFLLRSIGASCSGPAPRTQLWPLVRAQPPDLGPERHLHPPLLQAPDGARRVGQAPGAASAQTAPRSKREACDSVPSCPVRAPPWGRGAVRRCDPPEPALQAGDRVPEAARGTQGPAGGLWPRGAGSQGGGEAAGPEGRFRSLVPPVVDRAEAHSDGTAASGRLPPRGTVDRRTWEPSVLRPTRHRSRRPPRTCGHGEAAGTAGWWTARP